MISKIWVRYYIIRILTGSFDNLNHSYKNNYLMTVLLCPTFRCKTYFANFFAILSTAINLMLFQPYVYFSSKRLFVFSLIETSLIQKLFPLIIIFLHPKMLYTLIYCSVNEKFSKNIQFQTYVSVLYDGVG